MTLPISLEDARRQLRLEADDTSRDDDLRVWIADAAGWVEGYTGQLLEPREVTEHVSGFKPVSLRSWPIAADAALALAYVDATGTPVGVTGARLDVTRRPARVYPGVGSFWPFRDSQQPFTVTLTAGYSSPDGIPRELTRAMLILISAYDSDREGGDLLQKAIGTAEALCNRFQLRTL